MERLTVYVEGFRGPWGWVPHFEKYLIEHRDWCTVDATTVPDEADIIFHCDPANWRKTEPWINHPDNKVVVANVLDFADWHDGTPSADVELYVDEFCSRANKVTAISDDVIGKLSERGINAEMFYYPSQVDDKIIRQVKSIPKQKRFISFCRLGDPGKRIELAVNSFANSGLDSRGWQYFLIGPEPPRFIWQNQPGVKVFPYMDKETLYSLVASAMATIMPSDGEGLGLPAIESLLVGTIPIARNKEPMKSIIGKDALLFDTDNDLTATMLEIEEKMENMTLPVAYVDTSKYTNWEREKAFSKLCSNLKKWHNENQ